MMEPWRLLEYVDASGRNPFREWYVTQPVAVRAALDAQVAFLMSTDNSLRKKKIFLRLFREHVGLHEIRFWPYPEEPKRKFRVVGLYRPDRREFVFFGACEKQLGVYKSDAFGRAKQNLDEFLAGKGMASVRI
jgi:hypothetical protein